MKCDAVMRNKACLASARENDVRTCTRSSAQTYKFEMVVNMKSCARGVHMHVLHCVVWSDASHAGTSQRQQHNILQSDCCSEGGRSHLLPPALARSGTRSTSASSTNPVPSAAATESGRVVEVDGGGQKVSTRPSHLCILKQVALHARRFIRCGGACMGAHTTPGAR